MNHLLKKKSLTNDTKKSRKIKTIKTFADITILGVNKLYTKRSMMTLMLFIIRLKGWKASRTFMLIMFGSNSNNAACCKYIWGGPKVNQPLKSSPTKLSDPRTIHITTWISKFYRFSNGMCRGKIRVGGRWKWCGWRSQYNKHSMEVEQDF